MKQLLQNLANGATMVADVPRPALRAGQILIATELSLVSAGTERMLVDFGRANWLEKARQQPDKVRQVLDKVRTDGLLPTLEAVRSKLDQPLAPGYCNVGRVLEIGAGVEGFQVGDFVVSNGKHAEVVAVPSNLCARIPEGVDAETAVFTVLAAIGLQGIRLAEPTLGECVVVSGLGLIGLITVQLLRAQGCRVLGLDFDPARLSLAERFGAQVADLRSVDPMAVAHEFSRGRGVDAVLIAASTKSDEPVHQAAQMCRKRGRIVLIGVTGLHLSRADFYEKELSFQVSCSYGPGRYDPAYEEKGHDYPVGFVRWTEQRNFEAVLDLMEMGRVDFAPLVSHRFELEQAASAYDLLASGAPSLGILLRFGSPLEARTDQTLTVAEPASASVAPKQMDVVGSASVSVVGAGNYAGRVLIPAFKSAGARLHTLVSESGVTAAHHGRKFGFARVSTSPIEVMSLGDCDAVVIATRHDTHAGFVCQALRAGKHVFVEKPLCLGLSELELIKTAHDEVRAAAAAAGRRAPLLMVGFNRRFAPHVKTMTRLLGSVRAPKSVIITVNAGQIAADHWTQDALRGGGRIVGEGCHFIDLARHLTGESIVAAHAIAMDAATRDTVSLCLRHAGGSISTIHYFANGHRAIPKERIEVFVQGRVLQLDNFRVLRGMGWPGFSSQRLWKQDKGQTACVGAFMEAIRSNAQAPIHPDEIFEVSRWAIELA